MQQHRFLQVPLSLSLSLSLSMLFLLLLLFRQLPCLDASVILAPASDEKGNMVEAALVVVSSSSGATVVQDDEYVQVVVYEAPLSSPKGDESLLVDNYDCNHTSRSRGPLSSLETSNIDNSNSNHSSPSENVDFTFTEDRDFSNTGTLAPPAASDDVVNSSNSREQTPERLLQTQDNSNHINNNKFIVSSKENINARFVQYERVSRGLRPLQWSIDLVQEARRWAKYEGEMGHGKILKRLPVSQNVDSGWRLVCQNLSWDDNLGWDGAHRSLMAVAGNRDNILEPSITHIGVGVAKDRSNPGFYYMVQIFKSVGG